MDLWWHVIYILSFFKTYETFPVEIERAQAREHLTHARARCASTDRRARANNLRFGELLCARGELICARACRTGCARTRVRTRARILALLAHLARARLYLLARLARAPVVARAPRARTC